MYHIMVSGYGGGELASVAHYRISDDWLEVEQVWSDNIESPSYLSICEDMCFALTEKRTMGVLYCYKKGPQGHTLTDRMSVDGGALCYIHYSPKHKTLFGACYQTGHVLAAAIVDHQFAEIRSKFIIPSDDVNGATRAHCCITDHHEDRLFVCNIALDRVYGYRIENGALKENDPIPYIQLERGEGPRHIRFHPQLNVAYVITEYSNNIVTLSYDRITGGFKVLQRVSALPEGFGQKSFCSTLSLSPGGQYLYAANRGANTIAVFAVDQQGALHKIQDFDCGGDWPRHLDVTADGRFLMVANQKSGQITIISISPKDGRLEKPVLNIPFYEPSYVAEIL